MVWFLIGHVFSTLISLIRSVTADLQPFRIREEDVVCWLKGQSW